ncbi:NAD(P)H-dependent oxidoreductase [Gilvibacter sp.]|uniref:NAD(P)H-dependent oxidoreductase n=1 Tax=Gilvibacter sp. TaxID=2729997 RepID=UPI0025C3FDA1|nr:NAD(P)H-dependent oxidoreductase [Gilvibacter sp.]NQX78102.1 NAD(P)H-dependent oxidoreductase [Gilvibacter sp.]
MKSAVVQKLHWRYATKKFDPNKKLTPEQVDTLCESFNLTATSYGLQALKMVVISNADLKKQLVAHSWNQQQVSDASHLLVICRERTLDSNYIKDHFKRVEQIRNTPREILDPFEKYLLDSFADKTEQEISRWMDKQAYIALGNLLTVCAVEQIDSCPMEGFDPKAYDKLLELESKGLNSVLVLPVGYRAEDDLMADLKKVRRGSENVIINIE